MGGGAELPAPRWDTTVIAEHDRHASNIPYLQQVLPAATQATLPLGAQQQQRRRRQQQQQQLFLQLSALAERW